jgi:hypothetical protein
MALGSTQPLTEVSTRCISWSKGGRCVRLTTLSPSCAVVMKSGNLNFLEPSGPLQACNGTALSLPKGFCNRLLDTEDDENTASVRDIVTAGPATQCHLNVKKVEGCPIAVCVQKLRWR